MTTLPGPPGLYSLLLTNVPLLIGQLAVKVSNEEKLCYIDVNIAATEQCHDLAANIALELRLSVIAVLCLTGQDKTSAILRDGFQILIGENMIAVSKIAKSSAINTGATIANSTAADPFRLRPNRRTVSPDIETKRRGMRNPTLREKHYGS